MISNNEIMFYYLSAVEKEIYNALQNNINVLVHCFEGKHRSAAVVAYFLMKRKFIFDYQKAFDFIQKKRPVAFIPQDYFRDFLLNYNQ
jgi:protein-tyrosine phosphatase